MNRRGLLHVIAASLGPLVYSTGILAKETGVEPAVHRLVLHVDQNDPHVMNLALGMATNATSHYESTGNKAQIEIVANGQGLHMFRVDTSPVWERIKALRTRAPLISFAACERAKRMMEEDEGRDIAIVPEATVVPAGIARLMELQERGWSYVRP